MAIISLNEKLNVCINTFEEAAALRGFLVEGKYKGIRIGELYLSSQYESQKDALLGDKKKYKVICNGFSAGESSGVLPMPISVNDAMALNENDEPPFGGSAFRSEDCMDIDVDTVLQQLEELCLAQRGLGEFVTLQWDNEIRTVCGGEIVELKFNDDECNPYWESAKLVGEWVRFRGEVYKKLTKHSYWCDVLEEHISEWHMCSYNDETGEDYYLKIDFYGDNKFLDVHVSYKKIEENDNWLDPDIEKDMILGGCWD